MALLFFHRYRNTRQNLLYCLLKGMSPQPVFCPADDTILQARNGELFDIIGDNVISPFYRCQDQNQIL